MKKLWLWVTILVATAGLVIWQWQPSLQFPLAFWQPAPSLSQNQRAPMLAAPAVDRKRLLADLQALTFRRYDESARQQARDYILQELQAAGWTAQLQPFTAKANRTNPSGANGINIYAERAGTDPTAAAILLGAHYDTVELSPGADDNATAVATLLEAARLLGKLPTARTLQLVFFDLEEQGLFGSQAFVSAIQEQALQGAVILDMVGYACEEAGCQTYPSMLPIRPPTDRGNFIAALGDQGHPELLQAFTDLSASDVSSNQSVSLPLVLTLAIPTFGGLAPDLVRSDHAPFWDKGIGAVLITDTANFRNPHYHQPTDTIETLNLPFFNGSVQLVINAVARLLQS
ncbi:M28 family peptidase [Leptolyngbya sp. NK1-12]|uniref:M28 family peptidase n=1 Tax=Leptolyngbya sp. NK1-12 TaxID=2547451 RepID=A0AA96WGY1_9CYAN|nr:M28 family peptidase [Leptolyngbya sp. NK1-12]